MKSEIYFSATTNAFYPAALRSRYITSKSWPGDAKAVSMAVYDEFKSAPRGKHRVVINGKPQWADLPPVAIETAKEAAIKQINTFAKSCREKIAGQADHYQTAAWSEKARRAQRVIDETASTGDVGIVTLETLHRGKGETAAELAQIQLLKAAKYATAVSIIDGLTSSAITLINSAETVVEIEQQLISLKSKADAELIKLQS